jgi:hypothetical protein
MCVGRDTLMDLERGKRYINGFGEREELQRKNRVTTV